MNYFDYLAQHPEADQVFNQAMSGYTTQLVGAVLDTYDFSAFKTIVDIGGSYGTLLTAVLRTNQTARGILFDQPHVVAAAEAHLVAAGVAQRCKVVPAVISSLRYRLAGTPICSPRFYMIGTMNGAWPLPPVPPGSTAQGRLLVIELVLPQGEEPFFGKWLDLHMLVMLGARERRNGICGIVSLPRAGFELSRIAATRAGPSVIEAVPA